MSDVTRIIHALALATSNPGKIEEFRLLLGGPAALPITLHSQADVAPELIVIEDGLTFASNATKKASGLAAAASMLALADDSGLEVDALKGAPGIFSARYASPPRSSVTKNASDADNRNKLLADLAAFVQNGGAPGPWPARFVCALSLVDPFMPKSSPIVVEAKCEGQVIATPRGAGGFGYDPIFVPLVDGEPIEETMAELGGHGKHLISHRALACRKLVPKLTELLLERNRVILRLGC